MNLSLLVGSWGILAAIVAVLALYRKSLSSHEDDSLHVRDVEVGALKQQSVIAGKLAVIDKWGKTLTVLAAVYGLVVLGMFIRATWIASKTAPQVMR